MRPEKKKDVTLGEERSFEKEKRRHLEKRERNVALLKSTATLTSNKLDTWKSERGRPRGKRKCKEKRAAGIDVEHRLRGEVSRAKASWEKNRRRGTSRTHWGGWPVWKSVEKTTT